MWPRVDEGTGDRPLGGSCNHLLDQTILGGTEMKHKFKHNSKLMSVKPWVIS